MSEMLAVHIKYVGTLQKKLKQSDVIVRTERVSCHEIFSVGVVVVVGLCEVPTGIFRVL